MNWGCDSIKNGATEKDTRILCEFHTNPYGSGVLTHLLDGKASCSLLHAAQGSV